MGAAAARPQQDNDEEWLELLIPQPPPVPRCRRQCREPPESGLQSTSAPSEVCRPSRASKSQAAGLMTIVECHQPLLLEITGFLAGTPHDFAAFCGQSSRLVVAQMNPNADCLWHGMFARRWPAFEDCLRFRGAQDWKTLYREMLAGRCECTLEVFDREKKLGFAMAAMAARVQFEAGTKAYLATYLSATEVAPELIPASEEHRLRFCPPSARCLLPSCHQAEVACNTWSRAKDRVPAYPFRVLQGIEHLHVGQGVELQWKMQFGSPFGWWYGHLEALNRDPDGKQASATITFRHFPKTSRWYRLEVRFGDSELQPCAFGGYTGGIRAATEAEQRHWMRYFPKEPVVF